MTRYLPQIFLLAFALAALGAAGAHLLFTEHVAGVSSWNHGDGWQREIAFFDLFLAYLCLRSVILRDQALARILCGGLPLLSLMLGANHFLAYLSQRHLLHLEWALLNLLAILVGLTSLQILRRTHTITTGAGEGRRR